MTFCRLDLARHGLALAAAALLAACGESSILPPATQTSVEDTVRLWAVSGSTVGTPSAFSLVGGFVVRTDRTTEFDFIFDLRPDSTGDTVAVLIPRGAVGLGDQAGLQRMNATWDQVTLAPEEGYDTRNPVVVGTATVVVARSRFQTCNFGLQRGLYAKLLPLSIDRTERSISFRIVIDPNCGYRGLVSGVVPSR